MEISGKIPKSSHYSIVFKRTEDPTINSREVKGIVIGSLGINQSLDNPMSMTITHIESGTKIATADSPSEAIKLVQRLVQEFDTSFWKGTYLNRSKKAQLKMTLEKITSDG